MAATNFEIRRSLPGTISGLLPASTAMPVGTALMISAKDAGTGINTFALAAGKLTGFVTKEVRTTPGLSADEIAFGLSTYTSGEIATPFEAGKAGSVELAAELEVEGSDYIFGSGTGAITAATTAGTILSFTGGKFYVAQATDWACYKLLKQMTPVNGGACRIYVEKVEGYVVAS
jgi:hypothetical protein